MASAALAELEAIQGASARELAAAVAALAAAHARGKTDHAAERHLGALLSDVGAAATLMGRRRILLEAQRVSGRKFAVGEAVAFLPGSVPFREAINAILRRHPVLAPGWQATRDAWEQRGFALARAASAKVAERVQGYLARALGEGVTQDEAAERILGELRRGDPSASYPRAYADTVFRTVTASAYTEGRMEQARSPEVRAVVGGFRFDATPDGDVRPNHWAADGFVAALDDPVWELLRPPLGYNCRCALVLVGKGEAVKAGVVGKDGETPRYRRPPRGAHPDPGFRTE